MTSDEIRAEKAKNLRWKKPICKDLNFESMRDEIEVISCDCDDVAYYVATTDEDTLINALCGDEDEVQEFRLAFSDLSADCDRLMSDLYDTYIPEWFDVFFVAVAGKKYGGGLLGYDSFETDYYGLDTYESEWAEKETKEKLFKLTKKELFEGIESCLKVLYSYIGIKDRYTNIKAAIDILKGQNTDKLKLVKHIENLYELANEENFDRYGRATKELDNIIERLSDDLWL